MVAPKARGATAGLNGFESRLPRDLSELVIRGWSARFILIAPGIARRRVGAKKWPFAQCPRRRML